MNLVIKVIFICIGIKIMLDGFDMISNPDNHFFLRGICINCKSRLYGIILGFVLIVFALILFYVSFKKRTIIEYSICPKCKETYT
jgi:hypothetical protein